MAVPSIIQGLTDFFLKCPLLKEGVFNVNALGFEPIEYSIDVGVFEPVIAWYVNGDTLRQYDFSLSSREFYTLDRIENIQNSAFYEELADWVENQNDMEVLCHAQSLECLTSGYVYSESMKDARYTIQFKLTYIKTHREV